VKRTTTSTILTLTFLTTASSSDPTLTNAQVVWCSTANQIAVATAARQLGLRGFVQVWYESQGVKWDDEGFTLPSEELDLAEAKIGAVNEEADDNSAWDILAYAEWLEHPDGIKSCIAAYELR
jgi:hypothetical protein